MQEALRARHLERQRTWHVDIGQYKVVVVGILSQLLQSGHAIDAGGHCKAAHSAGGQPSVNHNFPSMPEGQTS